MAIADEVYEHLVFDGRRHKTLFALPEVRDRVVRIGSAGKTFSVTGWKVGYVTADAKLIAPIARAHQFVTFTTPPALQSAVAFGLRLPDSYFVGPSGRACRSGATFWSRACAASASRSATSARPISRWRGRRASTSSGDDVEFCRRLTLEAGVTAVPISAFYGERDVRSHIRFCFAKTRETLGTALVRLARWNDRARS